MAENGYGGVMGHVGRIPNYGKSNVNPMGSVEPPACIQNAMMTKDKKPFTYTPGGLDLSQIKTPSMARRLARQKSAEDHEQANYAGYHPQGGPQYGSQGVPQGGVPPPPPPPKAPAPPPPPPPIVIQVPNSKSPKPVALGERPEIVIPDNPIGMLRKTNSPYHWEAEKAELQKLGSVPKYVEKVPSPLTVKMPPSTFSQQQPQSYTPQNNYQRPVNNQSHPESPIHRPEAQYAHQKSASPNISTLNGSPPTRELLQRQDSQFNKSPQPFGNQAPSSVSSPFSPSPNNNWRQPEKRDSPAKNLQQSHQINRGPLSPNNAPHYSPGYQNQSSPANTAPVFHTLPRTSQRSQDNGNSNLIYNNTRETKPQAPQSDTNSAPWRSNTINRYAREPENPQSIYNTPNTNVKQAYSPPWKSNDANNNNENSYVPPWIQENKPQQQNNQPWNASQEVNGNRYADSTAPWRSQSNEKSSITPPSKQEPPRYQSSISIPVTPRKQNSQPQPEFIAQPQKEAVYVNQEPIYYCPDSPKSIPPWVKTQKEKTKTPPPVWCQRPLEGKKSPPRELVTPPRDANTEPEWVRRSNEMQRGAREVDSPPKYQQTSQPVWSTRPSENRKSLPKDSASNVQGSRIIPIQMEVSSTETRDAGRHGGNQPQLRITIGMNQNPNNGTQSPFSPPTQRIMRVLSPQLVRLDDGPTQHDLPTLNRTFQGQDSQPKTRIIPIQIESNGGANKSFGGRY